MANTYSKLFAATLVLMVLTTAMCSSSQEPGPTQKIAGVELLTQVRSGAIYHFYDEKRNTDCWVATKGSGPYSIDCERRP